MISETTCACSTTNDILDFINVDVFSIYNDYLNSAGVDRKTGLIFKKTYKHKKSRVTIKFIRKWGGDPAACGIGFYGSAQVVANSSFYASISLKELSDIIKGPTYGTMAGVYPRVNDISFTHLTEQDICLLVLNGFFRDTDCYLNLLLKDNIIEILKLVI